MAKKGGAEKRREGLNISGSNENAKVEKVLIENFVSLQRVMTNLAVKFENLSGQISKLLELFEISAKTLAEKGYSGEDKRTAEKLDRLIEQNKVFAKGIALLHERGESREQIYNPPSMQRMPQPYAQSQFPQQQYSQPQLQAPQPPPALKRTQETTEESSELTSSEFPRNPQFRMEA